MNLCMKCALKMREMTIFPSFRIKAYRKNVLAKCVSKDFAHLTNVESCSTNAVSYI